MNEKIELLKQLGWSDELIAELVRHEASDDFGLKIQTPTHFADFEQLDLVGMNDRPLFATELIVTDS